MMNKHKCEITNELGQTIVIDDELWLYDSSDEFIGDFPVNYCPNCGMSITQYLTQVDL